METAIADKAEELEFNRPIAIITMLRLEMSMVSLKGSSEQIANRRNTGSGRSRRSDPAARRRFGESGPHVKTMGSMAPLQSASDNYIGTCPGQF